MSKSEKDFRQMNAWTRIAIGVSLILGATANSMAEQQTWRFFTPYKSVVNVFAKKEFKGYKACSTVKFDIEETTNPEAALDLGYNDIEDVGERINVTLRGGCDFFMISSDEIQSGEVDVQKLTRDGHIEIFWASSTKLGCRSNRLIATSL